MDGVGGNWFEESVSKMVGNGLHSYFWYDPWLGGTPLLWGLVIYSIWLRIS